MLLVDSIFSLCRRGELFIYSFFFGEGDDTLNISFQSPRTEYSIYLNDLKYEQDFAFSDLS